MGAGQRHGVVEIRGVRRESAALACALAWMHRTTSPARPPRPLHGHLTGHGIVGHGVSKQRHRGAIPEGVPLEKMNGCDYGLVRHDVQVGSSSQSRPAAPPFALLTSGCPHLRRVASARRESWIHELAPRCDSRDTESRRRASPERCRRSQMNHSARWRSTVTARRAPGDQRDDGSGCPHSRRLCDTRSARHVPKRAAATSRSSQPNRSGEADHWITAVVQASHGRFSGQVLV